MVMRSTDRIIELERINPKKDAGLIDPRVFTGGNQLHAVMDPNTCMWSFKYENGLVPEPIRGRYTNFKSLMSQADIYFKTKNIKIVKIID